MTDEFVDLELNTDKGYFDISFTSGDFTKEKGFTTAILTSILTDARANSTQVEQPQRRRGWIGDIDNAIAIGSLNWLYEQARLINATVSGLLDQTKSSLQWLINFQYANKIEVDSIRSVDKLEVEVKIFRPSDANPEAVRVIIWENTKDSGF